MATATRLEAYLLGTNSESAESVLLLQRFLTMILDSEGAPVLMIGAINGLSLQSMACCIALCTNGLLKHLAFCA